MFDGMYAAWGDFLAPWMWPATATALVTLPTGAALVMWVGRRRFERRNFAGVEQFASFGQAIGHRLIESLVWLVASLLFFAGTLAFGVALASFLFGR